MGRTREARTGDGTPGDGGPGGTPESVPGHHVHHIHLGPLDLEPLGHRLRVLRQRRAFYAVLAVAAAFVLIVGLLLTADRRATEVAEPGAEPPVPGATGPPDSTAVAPTSATTGPSRAIRSIDARNATYPSSVCPETYRLPGDTFTLVDGRAGSAPDLSGSGQPWPENPRGVELQSVSYGDVTGDGVEEAAMVLQCYLPNSDALSRGVVVMGMSGDRPVPLAVLPDSATPAVGMHVVVDDDRSPVRLEPQPLDYDLAQDVSMVAGQLVVRWQQSALGGDALGNGYDVTVIYRIDGHGATVVGEPARVLVPFGPDITRDSLAARSIRGADLRSLTLPLAEDGRDAATGRVCPTLFDPLGKVRDAPLVNGSATVLDADGHALDATVSVVDVRYGFVDFDSYEDAVMVVRCTSGPQVRQTAVFVRWVSGAPAVTQVLGQPELDGFTTISARRGPSGAVEVTLDRLVDGVPDPATRTTRTFHWDPATGGLR